MTPSVALSDASPPTVEGASSKPSLIGQNDDSNSASANCSLDLNTIDSTFQTSHRSDISPFSKPFSLSSPPSLSSSNSYSSTETMTQSLGSAVMSPVISIMHRKLSLVRRGLDLVDKDEQEQAPVAVPRE